MLTLLHDSGLALAHGTLVNLMLEALSIIQALRFDSQHSWYPMIPHPLCD